VQLLALERPCRTGGRRAAELLLAAASGRLSWEQVVTGAVCSAQLEAKPQPGSQVVACNGCHALHVEACGQPQAAGTQLPTCWRCASPGALNVTAHNGSKHCSTSNAVKAGTCLHISCLRSFPHVALDMCRQGAYI